MNISTLIMSLALSLLPNLYAPKTAEAKIVEPVVAQTQTQSEATPYLLTQLEFSFGPIEEGYVNGCVLNRFTLFPSTVSVTLSLYSSPTRTNDLDNMTLENIVYISDLDQGETLISRASTQGQDKYWVLHADYSINGKDGEYTSEPLYILADGSFVPGI